MRAHVAKATMFVACKSAIASGVCLPRMSPSKNPRCAWLRSRRQQQSGSELPACRARIPLRRAAKFSGPSQAGSERLLCNCEFALKRVGFEPMALRSLRLIVGSRRPEAEVAGGRLSGGTIAARAPIDCAQCSLRPAASRLGQGGGGLPFHAGLAQRKRRVLVRRRGRSRMDLGLCRAERNSH